MIVVNHSIVWIVRTHLQPVSWPHRDSGAHDRSLVATNLGWVKAEVLLARKPATVATGKVKAIVCLYCSGAGQAGGLAQLRTAGNRKYNLAAVFTKVIRLWISFYFYAFCFNLHKIFSTKKLKLLKLDNSDSKL